METNRQSLQGRGTSIAGRRHDDGIDYYQTPEWATWGLLKHETLDGLVWEPCAGGGAMSRVLENAGLTVVSSDLRTDDNVYGLGGIDFLDLHDSPYDADHIVTNPPYKYASEVVYEALDQARHKVALLLKLTFLESSKRKTLFDRTPLRTVYVFRNRITMHPEGTERPENSGTITYAWFVWEHGYEDKPQIDWID